jgi:hypothetical protein
MYTKTNEIAGRKGVHADMLPDGFARYGEAWQKSK